MCDIKEKSVISEYAVFLPEISAHYFIKQYRGIYFVSIYLTEQDYVHCDYYHVIMFPLIFVLFHILYHVSKQTQ